LNNKQLDELAALVNERGVVFFRDQDLTTERQVEIFEHFGVLDKHTTQKVHSKICQRQVLENTLANLFQDSKHFIVGGSNADWRTILKYTPWPMADFHADTSFEINRMFLGLLSRCRYFLIGKQPQVTPFSAWKKIPKLAEIPHGSPGTASMMNLAPICKSY
jgi:Taurine catabolism dioxygenase TauD, TfdA family